MDGKIPREFADYYEMLLEEVRKEKRIAVEARKRLAAPTPEVEVMFAEDLAKRVELLVGPKGVAEKIKRLFGKIPPEKLAFKLVEDILGRAEGRADEQTLLQAIRTSLAVLTPPCITAAPTEGIVEVKIKRNPDGSNYLAIYFAGPIRSAGGTELAAVVVLADYVRRIVGLDRYKPTYEEIMRFIEELRTYRRKVMRFQYNVPDKVLEFVLKNLPVEVTGIATDRVLTPSFRDLPRIETNYLRGGALRVVNDGIAGRAKKVLKLVEKTGLDGWEWIREVVKMMEEAKREEEQKYFDEVVGGRPILSLPDRFGGLRLRYGRAPATGMAAVGLHPITLEILEGYVVAGTQLKLDYPGKGGAVAPVDSIEPPVVLTEDGWVVRLDSWEKLERCRGKIVKVLFIGDILISAGDLIENNVMLRRPGYCEEWWAEELRSSAARRGEEAMELVRRFVENPVKEMPSVEEAVKLSFKLSVPLHPRYTPFWINITVEEAEHLRRWLRTGIRPLVRQDGEALLPMNREAKETLTRLLIEHRVVSDRIAILLSSLKSLIVSLAPFKDARLKDGEILRSLEEVSGIPHRDKAGTFVGARMGRPEKAAQREMSPPVNVLFPVGLSGGPSRDLAAAVNNREKPVAELVTRRCPGCGRKTWKHRCPECGALTEIIGACSSCGAEEPYRVDARCPHCGGKIIYYRRISLNIAEELYRAARKLNESIPAKLKGVKGLSNMTRVPEPLEKGVLRAKYGLYVYKDGTIRFDATNLPLTHFTPDQIGVSVEKLRELGYTHDVKGDPLTSPHQILELRIQDIVIPRKAAEHLFKVSKFIDDELEKLAGMESYYRMERPEDVVGKLVVVLSPHTYAASVARVIGIVDGLFCLAHPILHAAKRRDCDGDEDSIMLLLDPLINFSKLYIPEKVGGKMDTPLLITVTVYPEEVDEQAHNLDIASRYPLDFYRCAERGEHVSAVSRLLPTVKDVLGRPEAYGGASFTHPQSSLTSSIKESSYKRYTTMLEKIVGQLRVTEKLSAVDTVLVAERITESHILPDILGNARAFFTQKFRCKRCGTKYKRPPLSGKCLTCGGEIMQTVFRGAIEKYVELTEKLLSEHIRNPYLRERVALALENVREMLARPEEGGEPGRQLQLERFM